MENIITNRKAKYEYEILERFTAGIVLSGYEVKPIKNGKCSISESHCYFDNDELFIKNLTLSESVDGDISRTKKLLLNRGELDTLHKKMSQKGLTIIPLSVLKTKSHIKIEIGLCRGRKLHDKRATLKEKDTNREINQQF